MTDTYPPTSGDEAPERAAILLPSRIIYTCQMCGASGEEDVEEVDASGLVRVPDERRFTHCESCGTFLDIGWAGWAHHDAAHHRNDEVKP